MPTIFKTRDSDVATFLIYSGQELIKLEAVGKVVFVSFKDQYGQCPDLERVYLNSECKKFKDLNKWLVGRIKDCLNERE